jgi:predicted Ser/Thr protein kinase
MATCGIHYGKTKAFQEGDLNMNRVKHAMDNLDQEVSQRECEVPISYTQFLKELTEKPTWIIRNVFQVFHDMIKAYVGEGLDEYPNDPESISFVSYDCSKLLVEGSDHPFFADRVFANRFISHVESFTRGAQQNKIYIFDGPHGSGKSTFLNNLLLKFEEYANTEEGSRYEVLWRLDRRMLGDGISTSQQDNPDYMFDFLEPDEAELCDQANNPEQLHSQYRHKNSKYDLFTNGNFIDVPCPSHDHPLLMVPKEFRRRFLDDLLENDETKERIFNDKEFDWVFRETPCTICTSIYEALLKWLQSPIKVFGMIYARPYRFSRRLGEGISVYNPGDKPMRQTVLFNPMLQQRINTLLKDSNLVKYIFSRYAKTNNGIYALMDIKSHNTERLMELHNIISEGIHKVEDTEENVNSLFFALMNPEDKKNVQGFPSFSDRIEYINIPYVLDLRTEVEIYRNVFGKNIDNSFLPRVLHNFARVIISSRLMTRSDALLEWIGNPATYRQYCDENLQLLKMEIYTGNIPRWLNETDLKRFTANRRRKIIGESKSEGTKGFSGRDSIKIFNEFYSNFAREDRLINMSILCDFFKKTRPDLSQMIPTGFIESLLGMYDYTILQEVKECLYYYNEEQITRDILNYIFSVNFEPETTEFCKYTGQKLYITEAFFSDIERRFLGNKVPPSVRKEFRQDVQRQYTSKTLTQEMMLENKPIEKTNLFESLHERYVHNLKEKVLDPFLENENFRKAIKDFGEEDFKTYDRRIRDDVTFLMKNLCTKARYTSRGAKEVCIYVIDNDLAKRFA